MPRSVLLALAVTLSPLAAQARTWIVDQDNGPGTDFLDLPPAVAAAADGDTIRIRAGYYGNVSTGKALTLLGDDGVQVQTLFITGAEKYGIEVTGLPAGATFVAKNLHVWYLQPDSGAAVHLVNNAGSVHLEDVDAQVLGFPIAYGAGALITDCSDVTWTGGELSGRAALWATRSTVVVAGATLRGADACVALGHCNSSAWSGLITTDSAVHLAHTSVRGGSGDRTFGDVLPPQPARPAANLAGGTTTLTGDGNTRIVAGVFAGSAVPAIEAHSGTLHVDTSIVLASSGGAPDISGAATVERRRIAALVASGAPPGGTLRVTLTAEPGDGYFVAASGPSVPLVLPFGTFYLDLVGFLPLGSGNVQGSGVWTRSLTVPGLPSLHGQPLAMQAAVLSGATLLLELSNPAVVVLD